MKEITLGILRVLGIGVFIVLFYAYLPWVFVWGKSVWESAERWDCETHGGTHVASSTWNGVHYLCEIAPSNTNI